jgi:hypothetical protein
MRPKDVYVEEHLAETQPDDAHAGCTGPDTACPECLAGYHRDMAELAETDETAA